MFLKVQPIGVNVPDVTDRMPVWQVVSGDDWSLSTRLTLPGGKPAIPESSRVVFAIAEDRFSTSPIWTGTWDDGITPADPLDHPGLVTIRVPDSVTKSLRRGAYAFSITVADKFGRSVQTVLTGVIQVEYEPTGPVHNIPYRS